MPQNCLVGQDERIPGLIEDFFPAPREFQRQPLEDARLLVLEKKTIHVHNLKLSVSHQFESQFEAFLKRVTEKQLGTTDVPYVSIQKRNIYITVNNSWKDEEPEYAV